MSLFGFLERRSIENPAVPLTDTGLLSLLAGPPTEAGVPVTEYTAMNFSAVYRCVALISGLGGALPIVTYRKGTKERVEDPLVDDPHPDMTPVEFWRLTYVHRALWGNFYAQKLRTRGGKLQYLMPLLPSQVLPQRVAPSTANPAGKIFNVTDDAGRTQPMTSKDIFHLPGLGFDGIAGTSPVKLAAQGIGLALGAERYAAKLFGSGNLTSGILTTDQKLTEDQAKGLKGRWRETTAGLRNAHEATIMDAGLKWQSLSMPNDDAQLLESRRFELTELGRYFGVPPFLLFDHEKSTTWGSGLEQQMLGFINVDLHPTWLGPTEQRITKELLGNGLEARYDMRDIMRGDSVARANYYQVMFGLGGLNANEIRFDEDLPPVDGGDEYLKPTVEVPVGPTPVIGGSAVSDSPQT